jgi:hypothetical protein
MGLGRGRRRDPDGRADPRAGPAAAEARLLTNVPWSPGGTQRGDRRACDRADRRAGTVLRNTGMSRFLCPLRCRAIASTSGLGHAAMAGRRASPSTGSPRARGVPLDAAVISGPAVVVRCSTRATHHTGGSSWRHCIPPLNASRGHSRGRPVRGGTVHGSRPSPGERGWVGQASLTRTRRRSGGTSRSGPMMSGSIPTRDSPARAAATHARLTGHGFSVCSSFLRPHSMEAGYVSGLGRSALRSGCTAGVRPSSAWVTTRDVNVSNFMRPVRVGGSMQ